MKLGVDDIARISWEVTRKAMDPGGVPWQRVHPESKDDLREETRHNLENEPKKVGQVLVPAVLRHIITQQLREYM